MNMDRYVLIVYNNVMTWRGGGVTWSWGSTCL